MDLLGSILNSMDKPPTVSDKQKELLKRKNIFVIFCDSYYFLWTTYFMYYFLRSKTRNVEEAECWERNVKKVQIKGKISFFNSWNVEEWIGEWMNVQLHCDSVIPDSPL